MSMSLNNVDEANGDTRTEDGSNTEDATSTENAAHTDLSQEIGEIEYMDLAELRCGISLLDDFEE